MPGHRRISTELFLKHLDRKGRRSKVEALLELDLDTFRDSRLSTRAYARLWGWHRDTVDRLVAEYDAHADDLGNANSRGKHTSGERPESVPASGHRNGHPEPLNSRGYVDRAATETATERPEGVPPSGHFLEQEPEPEGREAPPRSPSALSGERARTVGPSEGRRRLVDREIGLALDRVEDESNRGPIEVRLRIIAETILACGRVPDEAQLRAYVRTTRELPPVILKAACDEARATDESGRGFPPSESRILSIGRKLVARRRRAAREGAS